MSAGQETTETWMCRHCFPEGVEFGMIAPGYSLILNKGKYHVLGVQGHKGEEVVTFLEKPWVDPDPECSASDVKKSDRWFDMVDQLDEAMMMHPGDGYDFVTACLKTGPIDGRFGCWLVNKAGALIESHNRNQL